MTTPEQRKVNRAVRREVTVVTNECAASGKPCKCKRLRYENGRHFSDIKSDVDKSKGA